MLAMLTAAAQAQQGSVTSNRLMFDPNGLGADSRKPAQPQAATAPAGPATTGQSAPPQPASQQVIAPQPQAAPKPTAPKPAAPKPAARATAAAPAKPAPVRRTAAPTERVITDATATDAPRSVDRPVPREQPNLGRLALPQGSFGYEGRTQMQAYDMSDGRRVPGFDNIQRNNSSYFGLSLRLPTANPPSSSSSSPSWSSSPSAFGGHGAN